MVKKTKKDVFDVFFETVEQKKLRNFLIVLLIVSITALFYTYDWTSFFQSIISRLVIILAFYMGFREGLYNTYDKRIEREKQKK